MPQLAEVNASEGLAAFEHGQFDEAKKKLGIAAKAFQTLKATDETATSTIQYAKEAAIFADQAQHTLNQIVDEIARLGDPEGVARFDSNYKTQAILVESDVEDVRDGVLHLAYRIHVGQGPIAAKKGKLDLKGFQLYSPGTVKKDDHLIFGARLGSIRLEDGYWLISLEPESGVHMTNAKALALVLAVPGETTP